ncbi:Glycosyl hydrolase family 32, N-terminal [Sesbania bispinosa]|nr:Glycosyl hydrolase family 32, N-terminal [Sesbania bispinosa]
MDRSNHHMQIQMYQRTYQLETNLNPPFHPKSFDKYGCWSGSATILPGQGPVILYTGVVGHANNEVQCYAIPENASDHFSQKGQARCPQPIVIAEHDIKGQCFVTDMHGSGARMTTGGYDWWQKKDRGMAYLL